MSVAVLGCTSDQRSPAEELSQDVPECVDRDGDGFGTACELGADCDDDDKSVQRGCLRCATPSEGCACAEGTVPESCYLDKTKAEDGGLMCHEGTRYCREGLWSGCESIHSFPLPQRSTSAIIDPDGGSTSTCNDCNTNCHSVTDPNEPTDGGLGDAGQGVDWVPGGGITLDELPDSGTPPPPPPEQEACVIGQGDDEDCDGIPDIYDPYPNDPPFFTANPAIFLDIAPGQTGTGAIDLQFMMNSADVYFLVDQSGSMDQERDQLVADLTTGTFVTDPKTQCADYDFDRLPNNEQKDKGIVGAIRCKIRDASFGVGLFRELPFTDLAPDDQVVFANYHDISDNVDSVRDAINRLKTDGNYDWPEAAMVGLNTVLTGDPIYLGTTKRGVARRTDCAGTTWGYPCFRQGAIPIVVMFTDAQFHNGPSNNTFPYPTTFPITQGTGGNYVPLATTNEDFASAKFLDDLTNSYTTFAGNTGEMRADFNPNTLSSWCASGADGNDALFSFELKQQRTVTIDSTGSQFDTVLGLFTGVPGSPTNLTASTNTNEVAANALNLGQAYNSFLKITGETGAMAHDYQWSAIECGAATDAPDAVFKFNLSQPTKVALDSSGSSFDTVLALFAAPPELPPTYNPLPTPNTNDTYDRAYNLDDIVGLRTGLSGSTTNLVADYSAAQVGCGAVAAGKDAAFNFRLSAPRRVRISSEGSSFDTVLALFDGVDIPSPTTDVPTTNEREANAFDIGTMDGQIHRVTGTTGPMFANYFGTQVGCNAHDAAGDAVFKFHLDAPRDIQIDSTGGWNSVLALYDESFDTTVYATASNTNEALASAKDLGLMNGADTLVTGNTTDMASNYGTSANACIVSNSNDSPDAYYRFRLASPTSVRLDLSGSSFDTTVAVHKLEPPSAGPITTNDAEGSAKDVGSVTDKSFVWNGSITSLAHNYNVGCSANTSARDAVFKFSVTGSSSKEIQIETDGDGTTSFDTVIGLYPATIGSNQITCDNDGGAGSKTSLIKRTLAPGDYHVVVSSTKANATGAFSLRFRDTAWWGSAGYVTCNDNGGGGTVAKLGSLSLTAGDYGILVKGHSTGDFGAYSLRVTDIGSPPVGPTRVACDDDGGGGGNARITQSSLPAGDYYIVLKGNAATAAGSYTLTVRDGAAPARSTRLQCDDNGGDAPRSVIERDLVAGTYQVVLKGKSASDAGAYKLSFRDMAAHPVEPPRLACDNDSGAGTASFIQTAQDLPAGDYYVTLKGNEPSSSGAYALSVRDVTRKPISSSSATCNDNISTSNDSSRIQKLLDPGTYYVSLKGKTGTESGNYQLSIGGGTTSAGTYAPPTWTSTLAAIQKTKARVITILSCHDDPTYGDSKGPCKEARTQATALANASKALGANLAPLVLDIDRDGTGLSGQVVDAISDLSAYLEMDVKVRLNFEPDANPGFNITLKAIDQDGDGCDGLVGLEHQNCVPGASPRFVLEFENPLDKPVPKNKLDPGGGYSFQAELIGDGSFIVDKVPIYIIPASVAPPGPPPPEYYTHGTYRQDVVADACSGNEGPDWSDLRWAASVYGNTSVSFSVCASADAEGLQTCTPNLVAKVSGTGACSSDADCSVGYCATSIGFCQVATSNSCTADKDCISGNAFCDLASKLCTYERQPVYIGKALGASNYLPFMRMLIGLDATQPFEAPPVLHSWEITYQCRNVL